MSANAPLNRRQFERFDLPPMYSPVTVQRIEGHRFETLEGFAYDISEGGIRIELEERLAIGEHVNLDFVPPGMVLDDPESAVRVAGTVSWITDEEDDPAMPRMAIQITRFLGENSRERLGRFLGSGLAQRAA